ncbi:aminopeptidase [uncultured Boseongicola sp.]|jgi:aminopeptidase|uniref:aminopeptidase n=1 Tax=uncultured Boseongicola sp. TaxID=1648499 RepID=UPI00263114F6|nr:aminopeptidase [uncultured Boseongicola sp.]
MSDANLPFDIQYLERLADVAIGTGLNLQPGQQLVLTGSAETLPLLRRIAIAAYKAGASVVTPILSDEAITRARYMHGADNSFDAAPDWLFAGMGQAYEANAARLHVSSENPMALSDMDADKVGRASKANAIAYKPALEKISSFAINWSIISYPGRAWAQLVFPEMSADDAQAALAKAIFAASRVDCDDPVAAWDQHNIDLATRRDWLNDQRLDALHFKGSGTDLTVGLADGHLWSGGAAEAKNGITCNPNIPTEEVFTTPHAARVNGTARASKPLSHQGSLIENIEVHFENGRIVKASATRGEEVFQKLIETDEGASRLGEVALVPHASPISESGLLFYNTLYDENAACHIALGQCYKDCLVDADDISDKDLKARGGNSSLIHVDWMIGGAETEITGITQNGERVPVFRGGNWAN